MVYDVRTSSSVTNWQFHAVSVSGGMFRNEFGLDDYLAIHAGEDAEDAGHKSKEAARLEVDEHEADPEFRAQVHCQDTAASEFFRAI